MANIEHLEILKSGVIAWNRWRKKNSTNIPDLRQANLSGLNLRGVNLEGAVLTDADLSETNLDSAILNNTYLTGAVLTDSILSNAQINNSFLVAVYLKGTYLINTMLLDTDLSGSFIIDSTFVDSNLNGANLTGAIIRGGKLKNVNFSDCKISNTIFSNTNLSEVFGLDKVRVENVNTIDFQTLRASKNIPKSFLLKIGLPELYVDYLPDFYMDALTLHPVFLSHSWENKPFARKLYEALIAKGVNVFFDEKKMKPGDDLYGSISRGIEHFDKMILVCSKESLTESWWVDREIDRLLAKEKEFMKEHSRQANMLIPIMIDDYIFEWQGAKKEEIKRYLIGDFREWENEEKFEKALTDLIHALNVDRPDIKPKSFL